MGRGLNGFTKVKTRSQSVGTDFQKQEKKIRVYPCFRISESV
jgi:hypothetical protein